MRRPFPEKEGETKARMLKRIRLDSVMWIGLASLLEVDGWEHHFEFQVGLMKAQRASRSHRLAADDRKDAPRSGRCLEGPSRRCTALERLDRIGRSWDSSRRCWLPEPAPRQPWPLEAAEPLTLAYRRNKDWVGLAHIAKQPWPRPFSPS